MVIKKNIIKSLSLLTLLLVGSLESSLVFAGSATTNMGISASVTASCTISTSALSFNYDPSSGASSSSTANITATCTNGSPYSISFNGTAAPEDGSVSTPLGGGGGGGGGGAGQTFITPQAAGGASGSSGNFQRTMMSGSDALNYNLYFDSAHTIVLADSVTAIVAAGTGAPVIIPIYALIPGGQTVPAGNYSDNIVVYVNF